MPPRRNPLAVPDYEAVQSARRKAFLDRSRAARERALRERARATILSTALGDSDVENEPVERTPVSAPHVQPVRQSRAWSHQLMLPEWCTDVPSDLATSWYVCPRPEGARCVVVAARARTSVFSREGKLLRRLQTRLPNGSAATSGAAAQHCILDCIQYVSGGGDPMVYYVSDVMAWNGLSLYDCPTDFRWTWRDAKLQELDLCEGGAAAVALPFTPLPGARADEAGLRAAYEGAVPFTRDGLLLVHAETHYTLGPTPLALFWKDATCSRYLIETDRSGVAYEHQMVLLEYRMDHTVATGDDPPVVLGKLPAVFVAAQQASLTPGRLLRFSIRSGGLTFVGGRCVGADLAFECPGSRHKKPDTFSKILFQYMARREPLSWDMLLAGGVGMTE